MITVFLLAGHGYLSIKGGSLPHRTAPDVERPGACHGHISIHICFTQRILALSSPRGFGLVTPNKEFITWMLVDDMVVGGNFPQAWRMSFPKAQACGNVSNHLFLPALPPAPAPPLKPKPQPLPHLHPYPPAKPPLDQEFDLPPINS